MRIVFSIMAVLVCLAGAASGDYIGFSEGEGYASGALGGQPTSGGTWNCTNNGGSNVFAVGLAWPAPHPDLLWIELGGQHGPSTELTAAEYATKRMIPVTGTFSAG